MIGTCFIFENLSSDPCLLVFVKKKKQYFIYFLFYFVDVSCIFIFVQLPVLFKNNNKKRILFACDLFNFIWAPLRS